MLEQNEIYRGLLKTPSVIGLPMLAFVIFIAFSGLLFMWVQSYYILIPILILYAVLFVATKWDENFFNVIWVTSSQIKRSKNASLWGGNSYEP